MATAIAIRMLLSVEEAAAVLRVGRSLMRNRDHHPDGARTRDEPAASRGQVK